MKLRPAIAISGILLAGFVIPAQAQLDTMGNGMSDVWEREFNNGELFDPENPDHHPDADPDGDGWTNLQEYIAGTDPFSANSPGGFIPTYITYLENQEMPDPDDQSETIITDVAIISWDTIPGKTYTLWSSPDLTPDSWVMADGPVIGDGIPWASPILLSHAFEDEPERLFWRVKIEDPHTDSDGDGLTDYEEWLLGSDPLLPNSISEYFTDGWIAQHLGHIPNIFLNFDMNIELPNGNGTLLENLIARNDLESLNDVPELPAWTAVTSGKTSPSDDPAPAATRNKQVTVPAGTSVLLLVAIASEEFPEWTAPDAESSDFNDVLQWQVTTSTGAMYSDSYNVNEDNDNNQSKRNFHKQWKNAQLIGQSLEGMCNVVHYAHVIELNAPDSEDLELDITVTAQNVHDNDLASDIAVGVIPVNLIPDWNRDGKIDANDHGKVTVDNPWHFWINDNDSSNEQPHYGDVPGSNVDNQDMVVNGIRDLIDFFPVHLSIKALLDIFPAPDYNYTIMHPSGAFNFIEMPFTEPTSGAQGNGPGSYLANEDIAGEAMARPMQSAGNGGSHLSFEFLEAAREDKGILLFEAIHGTNQAIQLIVTRTSNNEEVARIPQALPVLIGEVETMYWRLNIRPAAYGNPVGPVSPPTNENFKGNRKDRWFVFCHGYNVDAEGAAGWNAEIFKRLHHKGNNARFVGVTWEGNQGQLGGAITLGKTFAPDYWRNVYNAFSSAHALASSINTLTGSDAGKTVISAHSLGNMFVSSAICDHDLKAGQYFLFNAAVAREAYSPVHVTADRHLVRRPTWSDYPIRLWSSDWKDLFPGDARKHLTWQNRFGTLNAKTNPHNFYSSGEDTVMKGDGTYPSTLFDVALNGNLAWIAQEMNKGSATKAFVSGTGTGNWISNGGWAFNPDHYTEYRPNSLDPPSNLPDTDDITDQQLRENPFFKPFTRLRIENDGAIPDSTNGIDLTSAQGAAHAGHPAVRAWLLAHDIPAISNPVGSDEVIGFSADADKSNTNMNTQLRSGMWGNWKHSDLKNQSMDRVGKLFEKIISEGNLK